VTPAAAMPPPSGQRALEAPRVSLVPERHLAFLPVPIGPRSPRMRHPPRCSRRTRRCELRRCRREGHIRRLPASHRNRSTEKYHRIRVLMANRRTSTWRSTPRKSDRHKLDSGRTRNYRSKGRSTATNTQSGGRAGPQQLLQDRGEAAPGTRCQANVRLRISWTVDDEFVVAGVVHLRGATLVAADVECAYYAGAAQLSATGKERPEAPPSPFPGKSLALRRLPRRRGELRELLRAHRPGGATHLMRAG
jgi:hypothetical protein